MPELPEVETMRRGVLPIVGSQVETVARTPCKRRPIRVAPRIDAVQRRLTGREILAVDRVGKRVVLKFDDAQRLVFEPRMTGLVLLADPPTQEHLRIEMTLQNGQANRLLFWDRRGLGVVQLFTGDEFQSYYYTGKLGPDALQASGPLLKDRLGGSRREVKVALLDQKMIAGVGNLYASELLFEAGVDPRTRCDRLTGKQWDRIADATVRILNEAITYEGSTLSDGTYRNALNEAGGYQNHHRVYDREDAPCPTCDTGAIRRIVQCQRSTFYCPQCQRKRG
ncbi:MAG: bifunctional DNA-formamidopyrimidine glycosylase/DNA-(apurinic or apyrimidinic site) lyase [bacterium]|nr:bifunctional DNA-formamidopyrimidine glycosylase/DNA-(apurinic or apyrimidinic site) lyase [bacterium]